MLARREGERHRSHGCDWGGRIPNLRIGREERGQASTLGAPWHLEARVAHSVWVQHRGTYLCAGRKQPRWLMARLLAG